MTDDQHAAEPDINEEYQRAVEGFRLAKQALDECDTEIELARMRLDSDTLKLDTNTLRHSLSDRNQLMDAVDSARARIRDANCELVRQKGVAPRKDRPKPEGSIVHRIIEKLSRF